MRQYGPYYIGGLNKVDRLRDHHRIRRQILRKNVSLIIYLSQNAKRASAKKDTGLDQSLFSVQLFRLRINIIKVCKGANKGHLGGLDKVFKIRDRHHRIHRQILRQDEGLILILAQS